MSVATSDWHPCPQQDRQRTAQLTLFCDFDGPLVDVSDRYYKTYQLALARTQAAYKTQGDFPLRILSKPQFWQMKQERTPDVEIAKQSGLEGEAIHYFLRTVGEIVNHPELLQKDKMQSGVGWALALLHSQGVRLVLVTLRDRAQATQILRNHGLSRLFSGMYGTEDPSIAYQNYSEAKKQLLSEAINQSPEISQENWIVGDTEADVFAGKAMGISTLAVTCGIRSRTYLERLHPTCIQPDLLSAAHYLIRE